MGKTLAAIGPFLADKNWKSENIEIHWGNGSKDTIVFTSLFSFDEEKYLPSWDRLFLFNGADSTSVFDKPYSYIHLVK